MTQNFRCLRHASIATTIAEMGPRRQGGKRFARRFTVLLTPLVVALCAAPSTAPAAEGDPFLDACLTLTAQAPCSAGSGPSNSAAVVIHPNGKWVYVSTWPNAVASSRSGVNLYDRNSSGQLSRRGGIDGCVTTDGSSGACRTATQLSNNWDLEIDKDGRNLYVPGQGGDLVVFDIDQTTGVLTQKLGAAGCFGSGAGGCTALRGSAAMFGIDIDGQDASSLYVRVSGGLLSFTRDTATGALTQKAGAAGCVTETAVATCTDGAGLANQAFQLSVAPDGNHLYTSNQSPGGVTIFQRFPDGSLLQPAGPSGGCITRDGSSSGIAGQCVNGGNPSLNNSWGTTLDPGSNHVYVAGSDGMTLYSRDKTTGLLTQVECYTEGADSGACKGRRGVAALHTAMLPDGSELVGGAPSANTLGFLLRDGATGKLTQRPGTRGCFSNNGSGGACETVAPLGGNPADVALADNGRFVYHTGTTQSILATFQRDLAPQCESKSVTVPHNTPANIGLGCTDVNGDSITLELVQAPFSGQLGTIDQGNRSVFYSPFSGFSGTDSFRYRAVARGAGSSPATVTLNVQPPSGGGGGGGAGTPQTRVLASTVAIRALALRRFTRLRSLSARKLVAGSTVTATCKTKKRSQQKKGCPYRRKRFNTSSARASLNLVSPFRKRRLPVGTKITVTIAAPGFIGKQVRYTIRKGKRPRAQVFCVPPGGRAGACA